MQLADMNDDGLQDAVQPLLGGVVTCRPYLGHGRFGESREMFGTPEDMQPTLMRIVDIDGDSLSDVVMVLGNEVLYSRNLNGEEFAPLVRITRALGGSIPEKTSSVSVRFADMNGSGSTDVVWLDASGQVTYLELVPKRPNLLTRIENGIGKVIEIHYGTSAQHMAEDGGPDEWNYRLPHPMLILDRLEMYDTLSGIRQIQTFHYANGYYDGEEHQFRGFADVVVETTGDDSMEARRVTYHYEVGKTDRYRKGLLLTQVTESNGRVLSETSNRYEDCQVAEVLSGTELPIRYVCQKGQETQIREGTSEAEWVTTEESYEYNGYGNRTLAAKLGVASRTGDTSLCEGDEQYEAVSYVTPGSNTSGRWILGVPFKKQTYGVGRHLSSPPVDDWTLGEGEGIFVETLFYYDGEPYVGLPLGSLDKGLATRTTGKVDDATVVNLTRYSFDSHGNVVSLLDPNGHESRYEYDPDELSLTAENLLLEDPGHEPYSLRMEVTYDPLLEQINESSSWMRVEGGVVVSDRRATQYGYDSFGRLIAIAHPGDTLDVPTQELEYTLSNPVTRIVTRARSQSMGPLDLESVLCFDGLGRKVEQRTKTKEGLYQVSGFSVFNIQGATRRVYQPYTSTSSECQVSVPDDAPYTDTFYDASGRVLKSVLPDGSEERYVYGPLYQVVFDAEDNDVESDHFNTPSTTYTDGLGRTTRIERLLANDANPIKTVFTYDELGRVHSHLDDAGNEKIQTYDLMGRTVRVEDPDTGVTTFTYDNADNKLSETDARGITMRYAYDELNRLVKEWDQADEAGTAVTFVYDKHAECGSITCANQEGRLAASFYPVADGKPGMDLFSYDERGRLVNTGRKVGGYLFEFTHSYDNTDRKNATIFPGGRLVRTTLDSAGRVTGIPGYVESVTYNERGDLSDFVLSNKTVTTQTYDVRRRLDTLTTKDPAGDLLQGYKYLYDRVNNIEFIEDLRPDNGTPTAWGTYEYDSLYRLTTADLDTGRVKSENLVYEYDRIDNLTEKTSSLGQASPAHVGTYIYGETAGPHAVTKAGDMTYTYDPSGNMVTHGDHTYDWDHFGRLVRASNIKEELAHFSYDPEGERIFKQEGAHRTYYITPDFEIRDGVATTYIRLNGRRVAKVESAKFAAKFLPDLAPTEKDGDAFRSVPDGKITAADAWIAIAIHGGWFDVRGPPVDRIANWSENDNLPNILLAASAKVMLLDGEEQVAFLHQNHLGTTSLTTDQSGRVVTRTEHYPYGEIRHLSSYLEDYSFTGQERDLTTALSYHSARYLDTKIGRWISADRFYTTFSQETFKFSRDASGRYLYALNNPLTLTDTSGRQPTCALDGSCPKVEGPSAASQVAGEFMNYDDLDAAWDASGAELVPPVYMAGKLGNVGLKAARYGLGKAGGFLKRVVPELAESAGRAGDEVLSFAKKQVGWLKGKLFTKHAPKAIEAARRNLPQPKKGQKVYRVYGGDAKPEGASWSPINPGDVQDYRNVAGLPSGGASGADNTGRFVIEGTLQDPAAVVKTRKALPLDGNMGKLPEYIIPNPIESGAVRIDRVSGLNPEF